MAFVKVEKIRPSFNGATIPIVTMGAYLADGKHHVSKSIMIRLTNSLIDQLGWVFDKEGAVYVTVHEGNGTDAGFLQITVGVRDIAARKVTRNKDPSKSQGISVAITVSSLKHYVLNECPVSATEQVHTVDGAALIIQCPDWLRYNPQSYKEPEVKKPTVPARPPTMPELIDELLDDPPPSPLTLNREQRRRLARKVVQAYRP